jgi:vWA-MoxR associated protein C-terminal domain/Trypsin-like peptidase domain/vWA-MoxR associated protein middle region (VMAP-M) 1
MNFSVDDYEKAIARILDANGNAIGTGFLIAPGYVLTCAHVVLQAIGIEKAKFAAYEGQPDQEISLDFHVLASGQRIPAKVVAWLPYSLEDGDVAALKLLSPEPSGAKPIPWMEVARAEVENEEHSAYGFGNKLGGRSDAYKPKANVAGGRFQLCKAGDPNDETIQPGFSGAPVWNGQRERMIGMVATAAVMQDEQKSKAYVIPVQKLQPVLKQVNALSLHEVLEQSLEGGTAEENERLKVVIDAVLRDCNPNGRDRALQQQLLDLSGDRAPMPGWEAEGRLVQFALMLARMDDTPARVYDRLKSWVEGCNFNFSDLLDRLTREMKLQKKTSSNVCQHLMVVVNPKETSPNALSVTMRTVPDRETYAIQSPPLPLVQDHVLATIIELPEFIRSQIKRLRTSSTPPVIHLFVPRSLWSDAVEMQPIGRFGIALGEEHPFVLRTNLTTHPVSNSYYDDWEQKWQQLETAYQGQTYDVFTSVDCSLSDRALLTVLKNTSAALLKECDAVDEWFELITEEVALPVAFWSRDPQLQSQLETVLDGIVQQFPQRIQAERCTAVSCGLASSLGHHLSLMWEDPKIMPPDMQFDPEQW